MTMHQAESRKQSLGAATARGLCLAASPTFALMALVTAISGGSGMGCVMGPSPLGGMVPMYLLMSAFHLAPWLKLMSGGSRQAC